MAALLAIFDQHLVPIFPTKFRVHWPFDSGEEVQKRFSKTETHLGVWIRTILAIFDIQFCPNTSYQVSSQLAYCFRRRREKIDIQDGSHGGYLGFLIGTI